MNVSYYKNNSKANNKNNHTIFLYKSQLGIISIEEYWLSFSKSIQLSLISTFTFSNCEFTTLKSLMFKQRFVLLFINSIVYLGSIDKEIVASALEVDPRFPFSECAFVANSSNINKTLINTNHSLNIFNSSHSIN